MTKLDVDPGACGFICHIEVVKLDRYKALVRFQSECKQISKLAAQLGQVDFLELMRGSFGQNPVIQSAASCGLHLSCCIPCALVKAVEAELGMAVKKDVALTFRSSKETSESPQSCFENP